MDGEHVVKVYATLHCRAVCRLLSDSFYTKSHRRSIVNNVRIQVLLVYTLRTILINCYICDKAESNDKLAAMVSRATVTMDIAVSVSITI